MKYDKCSISPKGSGHLILARGGVRKIGGGGGGALCLYQGEVKFCSDPEGGMNFFHALTDNVS